MHLKSISPWSCVTKVLATSLLKKDAELLMDTLVLLPSRRACRALRQEMTDQCQGQALILPRMMPFADLDAADVVIAPDAMDVDLLPPISVEARTGLLMHLILQYGKSTGERGYGQSVQAAQLAGELSRLIDQIHWEGLPFENLYHLVPEDYAQHWQITLDFLKIMTEHWPTILASRGVSDPAAWRRDLILAYAKSWRENPPQTPVIAAGSTGSIPCTAELLSVVAGLPQGQVILPGIDPHLSNDEWERLGITHPQYGMAELLETMKAKRSDVAIEDQTDPIGEARAKVLSRALQPGGSDEWSVPADVAKTALENLSLMECPTPAEEAGCIALIMRSVAQAKDQTVALITPDRDLANRVKSELSRWGLRADDSAGESFVDTPAASMALLVAQALSQKESLMALLQVLQHPLAQWRLTLDDFRALVLKLDKGPFRQNRTVSQLILGLNKDSLEGQFFAEFLQAASDFDALLDVAECDLSDVLKAHERVLEFLCGAKLFDGDQGQAFYDEWTRLKQAADEYPKMAARDYPAFLQYTLSSATLRQPFGYHPRLFILGPLEARTVKKDVMILGGLNEDCWPPLTEVDPWLNRPMRHEYGLPLPERRIGLSAHDFAQAFCARHVYCTRSLRVGGTPTVPSRWLLRLETVLLASGQTVTKSPEPWIDWYQSLDAPTVVRPCARPAPKPPLSARPKQLSVTQVETWMRDPYALYAKKILKLKEWDALERPLSVADKGTLIHEVLEHFVRSKATQLQDLLDLGQDIFAPYMNQPEVLNFWWPRFQRIAQWFLTIEEQRRPDIIQSLVEETGTLDIETDQGIFTLTAKADRIDLRRDGAVEIIDYKTGGLPTKAEIQQGVSPQLTLESVIVEAGGFAPLGPRPVHAFHYWRLRGANPAGDIRTHKDEEQTLSAQAYEGLENLIVTYADATVAYVAQPRPRFALKYNPYAHLTRTQEWMKESAA